MARLFKPWLVPLAAILAGAVFYADLRLPLGVAGGVPYVLLVFLGWVFPKRGAIFVLAAAATILTAAGYLYSPEGGTPWMALANRGLALLAIWGTAVPLALAKKTQEIVRESEERYALAVAGANDGLWDWDFEKDEIYQSPRMSEIVATRHSQERISTRRVLDSIHPDDVACFNSAMRAHLKGEAEFFTCEYRTRGDGNRETWVLVRGLALRDASGRAYRMAGSISDITERKRAEEALGESQRSLANAQRIAGLGNWDWDIAANELWWSEEIYRVFGLEGQEFGATYEAFLASVHPDDRALVEDSVKRALEGTSYSIDHRIVLPDGSERIVHEEGEATFGEDGRAVRMSGTVQDVTERKRAEEALGESEQRMRLVTDAVPALIAYVDSTHHYRFANRYYEDWHGIKPKDIVGKHIRDVFGDEFYEETHPYRTAVLKGEEVTFENEMADKNGNLRYLQPTYVPDFGAAGEVLGYFVLSHDVTERKQAEEALRKAHDDLELRVFERTRELTDTLTELRQIESALRESEERMRLVADNLPALIVSMDKDNRYRSANRAYLDWFGKDPEEIIGRRAQEVVGEYVYDQTRAARDAVLKGEPVRFDGSHTDPSGSLRHWDATYIPEHGQSGEITGYFALVLDITERKRVTCPP